MIVDQFGLTRSHSQQPFNNLKRRLIYSIYTSCHAATSLMANSDQVEGHHLTIEKALKQTNCEAFFPIRKWDIYNLDPQDTLLGERDQGYQGLILQECSPKSPDLESIMGDSVDPDSN